MAFKTYGKLQKGEADSMEFGFYGFRGGLNVKAAPQLVGDEDLTVAQDGYLRPDGAFQSRNGMSAYNATTTSGPGMTILTRFYQDIVNGTPVGSETIKLLAQFNGELYTVTPIGAPAAVGTLGGTTAQPMTVARIQDPNDPNHVSGLTDCEVICTGVGGPYIYDGSNLYTPAGWANASGAQYCAVVNGILWFGGIANFPNQIFGTGDGILASMESLPAYRNFILSAPVAGLVAQGTGATATLVIGRNTGVSVLYGTGPSTFFLQDVPFQDGVTAPRSMVSANGVVYWLGRNAEYRFDAQTVPSQISQKVEPWVLNDPLTPGFPMTQNRNLSWSTIYNNRLHLGYCSTGPVPDTILCYDLAMNGWTVLRPGPGAASMCLLDAPSDPSPYTAMVGSSSGALQAWTWDSVAISGGSAQPVFDGLFPVLAQAQSKYYKLGVPGTNKALTRFYPEFILYGIFNTIFTVSTDYGTITYSSVIDNPFAVTNVLVWDVGQWDVNVWGSGGSIPFGAPLSRIDYNGVQGDSFAFGVSMNQALAPWIWSGGTGVYQQRGKT